MESASAVDDASMTTGLTSSGSIQAASTGADPAPMTKTT